MIEESILFMPIGTSLGVKLQKWWFYEWLVLGLIVLVGLGLRLINLQAQPYWGDEVLSLDIVRHFSKLGDLITYIRWVEIHPPLYYVMLHYWVGWFGADTLATRSLSLLFGLGVIILTYILGKRLFKSAKIGLLAAGLIAILPIQIQYSQEARPYIIFTFFALLAAWSLWEYLLKRRVIFLCGYVVANLIGIYLHYSYSYIAVALGVVWLVDIVRRRKLIVLQTELLRWFVTHAVMLLGFTWWLDVLLYKLLLGNYTIFGVPRKFGSGHKIEFFESVINQLIWLTQHMSIPSFVIVMSLIAKLSLAGGLVYLIIEGSKLRGNLLCHRHALMFLLGLILIPLCLFLYTPDSLPYTFIYERHVLEVSVFLTLLLGWFLSNFSVKTSTLLIVAFCLSLFYFTVTVVENDETWNIQYRLQDYGGFISEQYRPGDLVVVYGASMRTDFNHFLRPELSAVSLYPLSLYDNDFMRSRDTLGLAENEFQFRDNTLLTNSTPSITQEDVAFKWKQLTRPPAIRRVWLMALSNDQFTTAWFQANGWRHAFKALGDLFPIDLYVRPTVTASIQSSVMK